MHDTMKIVAISDTHNAHLPLRLPDGDFLIHAGDASMRGSKKELQRFLQWFGSQPHRHKVFVAGNHDWGFQHQTVKGDLRDLAEDLGIHYLEDSSVTLDGVSIYGSPWQPSFCNWAFNLPRSGEELRDRWSRVPANIDILVTHTPPFGILDEVESGENVGCGILSVELQRIRPKVHIFGHIHESAGILKQNGTIYINAAICDVRYDPTQDIRVVSLESTEA